jgi:predicted transcriptional regulator
MAGKGGRRDEAAVRRFVEHMAITFADWGFPRMPARVLMTMMTADEDSLTAAELAERLSVSPAAISGAVRYLVQIGLLARAPHPGSRRERFRLQNDAWYEASTVKAGLFKVISDIADEGVGAVGGAATASGARVAEMRDYFRFIEAEMPDLLRKWKASKARSSRQPSR